MNWPGLVVLAVLLALSPASSPAAGPAVQDELAYTRTIEKRADDIITTLRLDDEKKIAAMRETLLDHYRALRMWHDANDAKLKELHKRPKDDQAAGGEIESAKSSLKTLHDQFIAKLSGHLTAEQVEKVKDKMTYNVVQVTTRAYNDMLPNLTNEQKAYILATLNEAREEAMDAGSSEEKHAVFNRYKGRINNYLSKQGYDLKKASQEWSERQKAAKAAGK